MEITKLKGQGTSIKTKLACIAVDAFNEVEELSPDAEKADFAISSRPYLKTERLGEDRRVFSWPGEYEVQGVAIHAHPVSEMTTKEAQPLLFVIYTEQFKVCYLPPLTKELHSDLIEKIGDVDLLIFTVSSDDKILQSTLEEIEPKAILPLRSPENPLAADLLIQKLGLEPATPEDKISFKSKSDFNTEKLKAYILN